MVMKNYNNREKAKETNIERYGVDNLFKDKEYIKECWENTLGVSHPMQREDIVQKAVEHKNYNKSKIKGSQTYFEKTGYTNPMKNPEVVQKMIESKIMNGVWEHPKVSNYKNKIVDSLQKVFGERDIVQHYRDKRYSRDTGYEFECDCYIKSLDLFIEINAYPTHYLHPFGIKEDDALIKKQLQKTNTDWSKRVLDAWCSRDVEKFNIAKKNNLNYLNVYTNTSLEENLLWNNAKYENILALILSIKRPRNKDSNSIDN